MGRRLTLRKGDSLAIAIISVVGGGLFVACIFVLGSKFPLVLYVVIALCGILKWVSVTRENRAKRGAAGGSILEIVGRPGIVVQECSPEGKVRIGDVTWSAISFNGITLRVGEKITVQDMQELKLTVKPEPFAMSVRH